MKQLISCLLLLCAGLTGYACNVCGGTAGNQYLGLLPQQYKSFIGFQYQRREFVSEHPGHREVESTFSTEKYSTIQVWGRTHIGKRVQVLAFAPYLYNTKTEENAREVVSGLGDITVIANYNLVMPKDDRQWKHFMQAGIGLKAPTGYYDRQALNFGGSLPNMQAGTESWVYSINSNYTLRNGNAGINADVAYIHTTANRYSYKYGNKLNAGLLFFYQVKLKNFTLIPQAGAKTDVSGRDYDNYQYKWKNDMTGGRQLYGTIGAQAFYGQLGLQCQYSTPFHQHFASGLVRTKYKVETGIYFLF